LMQRRAAARINHKFGKNPLKYNGQPAHWYMHNFEPDFACAQERRIGGPGDGPKWVCDPHRLTKISEERKKKEGVGCLVYSVGCAGKYHLEDGLYELLGPVCEIHVFDPGNFARDDLKDKNMHYHPWGFRSSYDDTYKPFARGEFRTLQETMEELGHVGRTIDIFKIDCEYCEWYSFRDWYDVDIRQVMVETHSLPNRTELILDFFYGFQQHDFYLFHKEPNIHPNAKGDGIEWAYIRLHPDFHPNVTTKTKA